jgi:predicted ATPase
MLIRSIELKNFLSFGENQGPVALRDLNVVIGPNGSGKSNLLEAIDLLRHAPDQLLRPIREGGGVGDWLWKGAEGTPVASLDVVLDYPKLFQKSVQKLRYKLAFTREGQRFTVDEERIENEMPAAAGQEPNFYYRFADGESVLNVNNELRPLLWTELNLESSILSQRKDPFQYPELTWLGQTLGKMQLYREWSFGRYTPPRLTQKADLPNEHLEPDCRNLGLVLNRLRRDPTAKQKLLVALRVLYAGIDDYDVQIEGGTVQVFLQEGRYTIPATRLSDGTLRYLCLLAILCHPSPPPLVCIEEPELGLHPDVLPTLADLLKDAATRTQLIVTTHSEALVDAMSDQPEAVLVTERTAQGSTLRRLDAEKLKPWLEKYRLGQLWTSGEIGGTRW